MGAREDIVGSYYAGYDEDSRVLRSRHGQLEYATTMAYIHRYVPERAKVLEIGAGTGRYSIAIAKEGMDVTAVELVESNLAVLKKNSKGLPNLRSIQGDAINLGMFSDNSFDAVLSLGPMYHLYEKEDVDRAIDEAIRVTRPGGIMMFAFISVFALMYAPYFSGNWAKAQSDNFTDDYRVKHFMKQLFTGYDVEEFEGLFRQKPVKWVTTAGTDGLMGLVERLPNFSMTDDEFTSLAAWYLHFSDKRELLGTTTHLLCICKKE